MDEPNFDLETVRKSFSKLSSSKAIDPDGLLNILLRGIAPGVALPLSLIFHKSYQEGLVPNSWKTVTVKPVYKGKGQKCNPESNRPISLTSVVCKVMESILKGNILEHLLQHHWFHDSQQGFLLGHSTQITHLAYVSQFTSLWVYFVSTSLVSRLRCWS